MILVMLATAPGARDRTGPRSPTAGTATAAWPVGGHGMAGSVADTRCAGGTGDVHHGLRRLPGARRRPPRRPASTTTTAATTRPCHRQPAVHPAVAADGDPVRVTPGGPPVRRSALVGRRGGRPGPRGPARRRRGLADRPVTGDRPSSSSARHQHRPGLRPLGGPDDPPPLEEVHQPPGPGEADPKLALQHGGRAQLRADHQLHRLGQQLVVVVLGRRPPAGPSSTPSMPTTGSEVGPGAASGPPPLAPPARRPTGPAAAGGWWRRR